MEQLIDTEHWCYNCKYRETKSFILDNGEETSFIDYCNVDETPCSGTYRCKYKEEVK